MMFLLILCLATGCSTGRQFAAENLPAKYQAPPLENAQTIDLSKLATSTISQDVINGGDVIEVSIAAGLSSTDTVTFPCRVTDQGIAQLPIVGAVSLKDLNLQEAESSIVQSCIAKGLYTSPHVTVTMKRPKICKITVLGAVEEPATYELRAGQCDVLQAIVAAGGLAEDASNFVQIRHPGYSHPVTQPERPLIAESPESADGIQRTSAEQFAGELQVQTSGSKAVRIDLASAATEHPESLQLQDGGIVMIEKRDPKPVHVMGLVRKPDRFEFPISEDLRMLDAVALAGGTDNPLADKVFIIRNDPDGGEPLLIEGSLKKAKRNGRADLRLAPGDIVSIEQTPQTAIFEALKLVGFGISGRAF